MYIVIHWLLHLITMHDMYCFIIVPVVTWQQPQVDITEGDIGQACFSRSVASSQPYEIQIGVREKSAKPATRM